VLALPGLSLRDCISLKTFTQYLETKAILQ